MSGRYLIYRGKDGLWFNIRGRGGIGRYSKGIIRGRDVSLEVKGKYTRGRGKGKADFFSSRADFLYTPTEKIDDNRKRIFFLYPNDEDDYDGIKLIYEFL